MNNTKGYTAILVGLGVILLVLAGVFWPPPSNNSAGAPFGMMDSASGFFPIASRVPTAPVAQGPVGYGPGVYPMDGASSFLPIASQGPWVPVAQGPAGFGLGLDLMDIGPAEARSAGMSWPYRGAVVDGVVSGCTAARAGVRLNDVVISFQGQPVQNRAQLCWMLSQQPPLQPFTLDVLRGGQVQRLTLSPQYDPSTAGMGVAMVRNPCATCPIR